MCTKEGRNIRICRDFKLPINKVLLDNPYPLPDTEDVSDTLGGGTVFSKIDFTLDLSMVLQSLHQLFRKGVKWAWTEECKEAFVPSKYELEADMVFVTYDEKSKLTLACDASSYGVGIVISDEREERLIGFVSRTVSKTRKELLANIKGSPGNCIWCPEEELYGRPFHLGTDHKPLPTILGPNTAVLTLSGTKMQRRVVILQAYNY